jgi:hypothetical protein
MLTEANQQETKAAQKRVLDSQDKNGAGEIELDADSENEDDSDEAEETPKKKSRKEKRYIFTLLITTRIVDFQYLTCRAERELLQKKELEKKEKEKKQPLPIVEKPIDPAIQAELQAQEERNTVRVYYVVLAMNLIRIFSPS